MLSLIIPALNEEERIEEWLKSLEEQDPDRSEYEIIVVDGESTLPREAKELVLREETVIYAYGHYNYLSLLSSGQEFWPAAGLPCFR